LNRPRPGAGSHVFEEEEKVDDEFSDIHNILKNCRCAPVNIFPAKQDITYKTLPKTLDTQLSSSFKKEEKIYYRCGNGDPKHNVENVRQAN